MKSTLCRLWTECIKDSETTLDSRSLLWIRARYLKALAGWWPVGFSKYDTACAEIQVHVTCGEDRGDKVVVHREQRWEVSAVSFGLCVEVRSGEEPLRLVSDSYIAGRKS